ncbi:hypothetical protein D3273_06650 [Lichenibacterium minor]|uniref:DUF2511 domain-containing protein n=1 Tax=Lichenibacterium minor TaxID=2316528 RepID=A0A4Q2U7S9_9HYPH|nr:hypothetical protein [Lichenibacterium minor]RYC32759.1 hypothetical protein D3273_06650 [Lichenibacterium minor]
MKGLLLGVLWIGWASAASAATSEIPYEPNLAGQTVKCADFKPGPGGTWTTLHAITVQRQNEYTTIAADSTFKAGGQPTVGIDVGAVLDKLCPR